MIDDIINDESGIYYQINEETLCSLKTTRFQIRYDLIIEYEKYRSKIYEMLKILPLESHCSIISEDDRLSLIITSIPPHDCRFYFVRNSNSTPIKFRLSRDFTQEQITLSIID